MLLLCALAPSDLVEVFPLLVSQPLRTVSGSAGGIGPRSGGVPPPIPGRSQGGVVGVPVFVVPL